MNSKDKMKLLRSLYNHGEGIMFMVKKGHANEQK